MAPVLVFTEQTRWRSPQIAIGINDKMTMELTEFGDLVRHARHDAEMTVRELAIRIGISYAYVSIIELGENPTTKKPAKPSSEIVLALANELGLDANKMLTLAGYQVIDSKS